jgi:cystathionine beta-lyase family protein involved in aluminum resistance
VERAAAHLSAPGLGSHVGPSLGFNRLLTQGFFMAPHVVAESLKGLALAAAVFARAGLQTAPTATEERGDIIQTLEFPTAEDLIDFCSGVQRSAPVDSFVSPVPAPMPGYDCEVIMAAGAFIQGSSLELSADAPVRPPYRAFMQGGLVYEQVKLAVLLTLQSMRERKQVDHA